MQSVSADHTIELAHTILCELNLGAVRRLRDSLNSIAKKQLDLPEMIPQDLTQGAANDLEIATNAMPKLIPLTRSRTLPSLSTSCAPCMSVRAETTAS
jgi:hypothetical protein